MQAELHNRNADLAIGPEPIADESLTPGIFFR
jgi:hypothetical protein